ncbi:uncharacterized protein LOC134468259 [Engraulis encrasicolus]|uniref:uncharacterized protein LOC134468259 n=1 Tax=Engraulis encrasicolus TaxID=184585 RepID=UPI002FD18CD0
MAVSSNATELGLVLLALAFGAVLNAANLLLTLLPLYRSGGGAASAVSGGGKVTVVSGVICSISLSNTLLSLSCIAIMLMVFYGTLATRSGQVNPFFTAMLYVWLSSCFVSFWAIAWLSVLYCVKVVSFSCGFLRVLKRNISVLVSAALLLTPPSALLLAGPMLTLRYVFVPIPALTHNATIITLPPLTHNATIVTPPALTHNATNITLPPTTSPLAHNATNTTSRAILQSTTDATSTMPLNITFNLNTASNFNVSNSNLNAGSAITNPSNLTTSSSTNPLNVSSSNLNASSYPAGGFQVSMELVEGLDIMLYTMIFVCVMSVLPLMVMVPAALRLVAHLFQHTWALRRNQTPSQSSASYLQLCKLTVSLVAVYAATLLIVSFYFMSLLAGSNMPYDIIMLGCTFYCVLTGTLLAASNRQIRDTLAVTLTQLKVKLKLTQLP